MNPHPYTCRCTAGEGTLSMRLTPDDAADGTVRAWLVREDEGRWLMATDHRSPDPRRENVSADAIRVENELFRAKPALVRALEAGTPVREALARHGILTAGAGPAVHHKAGGREAAA